MAGEMKLRIRQLREQKGLTQSQLAARVGCRQEKISSYEIGRAAPKAEMLARLANALETSADYLLGRVNEIDKQAALEDVLDADEVELVTYFRAMPQEKKIKLLGVAFGLKGG